MNVLFVHNNFPAQFRSLAATLAGRPGNRVVFATERADDRKIPGVAKVTYDVAGKVTEDTHPYIRSSELAVRYGQAAARAALTIAEKGFRPDIVVSHAGWGPGLFMKEVFPRARQLSLIEWFYRTTDSNLTFLPDEQLDLNHTLAAQIGNVPFLAELAIADWAVTPTNYQRGQIPQEFWPRLSVIHEGIDTDYFVPRPGTQRLSTQRLEIDGLNLSGVEELITYTTRGMEPYRGFPQFLRAAVLVLAARPNAHVVIAGEDRVAYGTRLPAGDSWKQRMLAELGAGLDPSRVHFVGTLVYRDYLRVLQASTVHAYLTVPFVLSWSLLEAMSTGCVIVGSDTAPLREVIDHGEHGLLGDFFDHEDLARRLLAVLEDPAGHRHLGEAARRRIIERYELRRCVNAQIALLSDVVAGHAAVVDPTPLETG